MFSMVGRLHGRGRLRISRAPVHHGYRNGRRTVGRRRPTRDDKYAKVETVNVSTLL
jgi:hypothetical protein